MKTIQTIAAGLAAGALTLVSCTPTQQQYGLGGAAAGGAFGAIEIEGEETAEEEPVESVKVLDKVSGGEELTVYLRADLLLFIEEENLPELK